MSELAWCLGSISVLVGSWTICDWEYGRIYGRRLKWWAKPLAMGALLSIRRVPGWERGAEEER